ncbi:hypothetical protein F4778DRAFT_316543 [Xylariomycetidae sp. FL2044]|nr:hypothetical protein F4778DRAFT_316543 [Xylariomycetidae sp. FL2044]
MYRRGPTKSTPANVQCQKCLKRGHYSYECKASAQERPYVSRPSRTEQLLNPKLLPKLTSEMPDALEKKKGVADEELAKREAERARKRQLERDDEYSDHEPQKRPRSASYNSVSSISTRGSPPRRNARKLSRSPSAAERGRYSPSPARHDARRQSYDSESDRHGSPSAPRRFIDDEPHHSFQRGGSSPAREPSPIHSRYSARRQSPDHKTTYSRSGRDSRSPSRSPSPENTRRFRSRSPNRYGGRGRSPPRHGRNRAGQSRGGPPRREGRERSLSPFSKRLALTQAMNLGR